MLHEPSDVQFEYLLLACDASAVNCVHYRAEFQVALNAAVRSNQREKRIYYFNHCPGQRDVRIDHFPMPGVSQSRDFPATAGLLPLRNPVVFDA